MLTHVLAICGLRCVQAFADIKNYYNDITHNNLDLIKSLKEDVHEMKKKEQQVQCNHINTPWTLDRYAAAPNLGLTYRHGVRAAVSPVAVQDEKQMMEIAHENIRMSEPLHKARQVRSTQSPSRSTAMDG